MMDKNEFWELIQTSYQDADWVSDKQIELLVKKLAEYTQEEIIKFGKIYEIYAEESNVKKLWAAAYIMNNGCSEDCFKYFRGWLISRGKEPYLNGLMDPDSIADLDMPYEDDYYENQNMLYVSEDSFKKKLAADEDNDVYFSRMKDYELDSEEIENIVSEIAFSDDINADWDENNEESLRTLLPNVYDKFW